MRCFVAIDLPSEVRAALARAQAGLRAAAPEADVRWVDPAAFHLTLKFLGTVQDARVPEVSAAVEEVAAAVAEISITAAGLGAFPSANRARVVWAGLADGVPALADLAGAIDQRLAVLGFAPEMRAFRGHLTIGRVRTPRGARPLAAALAAGARAFGGWTASEVALYESRLRPTGAVYTAVSRHPLRGCQR